MTKEFTDIKEYYDNYFNEDQEICYNNQQRYNILFEIIEKLPISPQTKVLDIGAGSGRILQFLDERFREIVSFDITVSKLFKETLERTSGQGVKAALPKLPFQEETFDLVVCSEVLEHLPSRKKQLRAIREIAEVLGDDGLAIFTTPNPRSPTSKVRMCREWLARQFTSQNRGGQIIENWISPADLQPMLEKNFYIKEKKGSYYALPPFASSLNKILIPISDVVTKYNILPNNGLYQYYVVEKR